MRQEFYVAALAVALLGGTAAVAQDQSQPQPQMTPDKKQDQPIDHQKERATQQGEEPGKIDGQPGNTAGRTPEKGQAIPLAPSTANSADANQLPPVAGAGPSTAPAKHYPPNEAADARNWLDRSPAFTPEQKQKILGALAGNAQTQRGAGADQPVHAEAGAYLPRGVEGKELPGELKSEIPYLGGFRYLVAEQKVLLVDPNDGTVAAVIAPQAQEGQRVQ